MRIGPLLCEPPLSTIDFTNILNVRFASNKGRNGYIVINQYEVRELINCIS